MTQDEIMQLAKDAGLRIDVRGKYFFVGFVELSDLLDAAIAKEREALAQEQEPVAWAHYDTFNNLNSLTTARFKATLATKNTGACCIALYITPPQRTWVGLTDKEIDSYFEDHGWSPSKDYYPVIKDIEAKLKEKNT
jgi:hypothetical protein